MSKRSVSITIGILVIILGGVYYFQDKSATYKNDDLGISFEYRVRPDGYILIEQDKTQVPHPDTVLFVSLFNEREYQELMASSVPREGPPNISVLVFDNPKNQGARAWADSNGMISNIGAALSGISETTLAGVPAIRYLADGLYVNEIIIASNNNRIYFLVGSYIDENTPIRKDFLEMLNNFSLY